MPRAKRSANKVAQLPQKTMRVSLTTPTQHAEAKKLFWQNAFLSSLGGVAANPKDYTAAEAVAYAREAALHAVHAYDQVILQLFDEEEDE